MQRLAKSNALDWIQFQNQLIPRTFDQSVEVFDKLDIHKDADPFQPLYLLHKCMWLAFVHKALLALIQWVCHCDGPTMHLQVIFLKNDFFFISKQKNEN